MRGSIYTTIFTVFFLCLFFLTPVYAQERSYFYEKILTEIFINHDTTLNVTETQTFVFSGEYHKGWRSIPYNKIDSITDIEVIDKETGEPLKYSWKRLDKEDPSSWGKFTNFNSGGAKNIEWYYNAKDEKKTWILKYRVHGALGFYNDHDELYWNILTDYDVPVAEVETYVALPSQRQNNEGFIIDYYSSVHNTNQSPNFLTIDNQTYYYHSYNIVPKQHLTALAGWHKKLIDTRLYWIDFLTIYCGWLLGSLLIVGSIIYGVVLWYLNEKVGQGRGTIVPQYEPPQNLRPAVMGVILREKVPRYAVPATIIDMAVRGFIRINEGGKIGFTRKKSLNLWSNLWWKVMAIFLLPFWFMVVGSFSVAYFYEERYSSFIATISVFLIFIFVLFLPFLFKQRDYFIEKIEKPISSPDILEDYERSLLAVLFPSEGSKIFSTRELKKKPKKSTQFYNDINIILIRTLLNNVENRLGIYEVGFEHEEKRNAMFGVLFLISLLFIGFIQFIQLTFIKQLIFLLLAIGFFYFIKKIVVPWEARLNKEGQILKEEILGFKMYLEKAEKYRLKNLTPDLFEKYLPYAMVFGVEKKWARAFDSLHVSPPSWYGGVYSGGIGGSDSVSSFPLSSFSSSFSASFASSISSSGAGGSGGGGAGGGGGGGGGGAS